MGKKSYFAAILVIAVLCLSFAVVMLTNNSDIANAADNTSAAGIPILRLKTRFLQTAIWSTQIRRCMRAGSLP